MASNKSLWKKGRGKLGPLDPLLGTWKAKADSPMGKVQCTRTFTSQLSGSVVRLDAEWKIGDKIYAELAIYSPGSDGTLSFWSFTSDGKRSEGKLADGTDVHAEAICFEAQMPAGLARMIYWPAEDGGVGWAVEAKNKNGWKRFTEHHYSRA